MGGHGRDALATARKAHLLSGRAEHDSPKAIQGRLTPEGREGAKPLRIVASVIVGAADDRRR
jgi:hypothetical protein